TPWSPPAGAVPGPLAARSPSSPGGGRGALVSQLVPGEVAQLSKALASQHSGTAAPCCECAGVFSGVSSVDAAVPVCVRWCFLRCPICEKPFPQSSAQWNGRSPLCVRWCILRCAISAKSLPQSVQRCGRSLVCVRWCVLRLELCANLLPQLVQQRGRSPVCVRWCILRYAICAKPLSQSEQRYGRSPVCMRWCILSFELSAKPLPQSEQWCGRALNGSLSWIWQIVFSPSHCTDSRAHFAFPFKEQLV
uniref:Uncharacterized protein n=1 Tax=Chelydra serpentina TaxID=8475 RepID=A0A8C3RVQ8_CHESE